MRKDMIRCPIRGCNTNQNGRCPRKLKAYTACEYYKWAERMFGMLRDVKYSVRRLFKELDGLPSSVNDWRGK